MHTDLLTVVVSAYNEAPRIKRAILPYLEKGLNVIAVNDGSTDDTLSELKNLKSSYRNLKIVNLPKNSGKAIAMQKGIENVKTPYVLFSDADFDRIDVDKILKVFDYVLKKYNDFMILYNSSVSIMDRLVNKPVTGMRILKLDTIKDIFSDVQEHVKYGYLIETYINKRVLEKKLPVFYYDLKYLQTLKAVKWGFLKGFILDLRMGARIMFHPWNVYNIYIKFFSKRVNVE